MKVHYNKDGTCWTQIYVGNKNGKRQYERVYADTKTELDVAVMECKIKYKKLKDTTDMTLRDGITAYIDLRSPNLSPSSISKYKTIRDYAFQDIMDMKMKDIVDLEYPVSVEARRKVGNKDQTISTKTLRDEYFLIRTVLKKYTPRVYREEVRIKPVKRSFPPLIEPKKITEIVYGTEIELPVMLAMWLSMTVSEIRGLTKSESIDGEYITIRSVLLTVDGKDVRKDLAKEVTRNRSYKLPKRLQELINNVEGDVICPMTNAALTKRFYRLLKANGLPRISFHELRHINASTMARLNIPKKTACERGGWSTEYVMDRVYTQVFDEERQKADKKINAYFEGIYATVCNTLASDLA